MNTKFSIYLFVSVLVVFASNTVIANEQKTGEFIFDQKMEPIGGQPSFDSKVSVDNLQDQVLYHRAFEAVIWATKASAIYRFRGGAEEQFGYKDNDIMAWSKVATAQLEALTANNATPYITAFTDLSNGAVILDIPKTSEEGTLYGQVVDHWQETIADVGPSGLDKGQGGKFLFTPPGYEGEIPKGYLHVPSPSYRIAFAFRSIVLEGKSTSDAYEYSKRLKMYYLKEAKNPPKQRFIDPVGKRYSSLPFYDERHFKDLHAIFSKEPVREHDKAMMGMLYTLGIKYGDNNFNPDEKTNEILNKAAVDAYHYMQGLLDNLPKERFYWPNRHYASLLLQDNDNMFDFVYDDRIDLDTRGALGLWATYYPRKMAKRPATEYLAAMADNNGELLLAEKTYSVNIPANMPVEQFWALTVYDRATYSFVYSESMRSSITSYDLPNLKKNDDGSVTLFVGPEEPEGFESNWLPTRGKRPLPTIRFYGPTDDFADKTFVMPDFELVK